MPDYIASGRPEDNTRGIAGQVREELALIQSAINSKADAYGTTSVSTTSMSVTSPDTKTFTIEPDKELVPGMTVFIADTAEPAVNNMTGVITSYNLTTGAIIVSVTAHNGSGTKASWTVGLSNQSGVTLVNNVFSGHQDFARATVASHATTADIWNATGNQIDWTGIATTTAFPNASQAGVERTLICAGACSFTAGANMLIEGIANGGTLKCSANDVVTVLAITTTQFYLTYTKYSGQSGGANTSSSAIDITLTAVSGRLQLITMTAVDKKVILPVHTTLPKGAEIFVLSNLGDYRFSVHAASAEFLGYVCPGQTVALHCSDTGVWRISAERIDNIYSGNSAEVLNAVASSYLAVAMLTTTKAICAFKNGTTTFLNAVILNYGSVSGTPLAINAEVSNYISIAAQTSSQATVMYKNATNVTKGYVLNVSGNTITPGAVATIDATANGIGTHLTALSSTQLFCLLQNGASGTIRMRVLDISASVITPSGDVELDTTTSSGQYIQACRLSATKALAAFASTTYITKLKLVAIAGSVPAATGSPLTLSVPGTDPNLPMKALSLSDTLCLITQSVDGTYGDIYLALIDVSGTTPLLLRSCIIHVGAPDTVYIGSLTKLNANTVFINWMSVNRVDGMLIRVTGDNKFIVSEISDKLDGDSSASQFYADCVALDDTHIMHVSCKNSSNYLSAKTLEVAI